MLKSKNGHFSKGVNPWVWFKIRYFSNLFFLGNIRQENVFYDILEQKTAFLSYKNKMFKKSKIDILPKGLTDGIGQKMAILPTFLLMQYRPGK